ncbi:hypothetical protein A3844_14735 [Paenibacillus helianthi]|uniref:Uncharacterized protein n=1 Tax=Paenibacillus helianthi TaxID=1349432 RepID=A0ABX3EN87_9BACL|nr:hypothetical protein [Paenibacillus helianthi]OKP86008.1 hypothetical protein A3844_14735 [Paenibacillus helianthi]
MPEYSHIQTYLKCNRHNFKELINHFAKVLSSLYLDSRYFTSELEWEVSDNGFMYVGGGAESQIFVHNDFELHIRPYVMGLTPEVIKELEESWLEVSLLFWTEEIELDWKTGQLKDEFRTLLWAMLTRFSEEFKESGVYFTNEVTDGTPWEALVCYTKEDLWTFDAAIIPDHLIDMYNDGPEEMFVHKNKRTMLVARKSVWCEKPWLSND